MSKYLFFDIDSFLEIYGPFNDQEVKRAVIAMALDMIFESEEDSDSFFIEDELEDGEGFYLSLANENLDKAYEIAGDYLYDADILFHVSSKNPVSNFARTLEETRPMTSEELIESVEFLEQKFLIAMGRSDSRLKEIPTELLESEINLRKKGKSSYSA